MSPVDVVPASEQRINQALAEIGQRRLRYAVGGALGVLFLLSAISFILGFLMVPVGAMIGRSVGKSLAPSWVPDLARKHQVPQEELRSAVLLVTQV